MNGQPAPRSALPAPAADWPQELLDRLAADPRVVGAASLPGEGARTLLVVTTWDGLEPVRGELPDLLRVAGGAARLRGQRDPEGSLTEWSAIDEAGVTTGLAIRRIGDLAPDRLGEDALPILDPKGWIEQWVRWSRGRRPGSDAPPVAAGASSRALTIEQSARWLARLPVGAEIVRREESDTAGHFRDVAGNRLRQECERADPNDPVERAAVARAQAVLASIPDLAEGRRVTVRGRDPAAAYEAFLAVADREGFLGDRVLFQAAVTQLAELSGRTPIFDEGFLVPTFDAVEGRWRFDDGVATCGEAGREAPCEPVEDNLCRVPLIACIHVGVGVTPADALEFWAAPAVREATATVACVHDLGIRDVRLRTAGKDALLEALHGAIDQAWERLPGFLAAARSAAAERIDDPDTAWKPLHLPKSFLAAGREVLALSNGGEKATSHTRLALALSLARAGEAAAPLVSRKLSLAAGRVIAAGAAG